MPALITLETHCYRDQHPMAIELIVSNDGTKQLKEIRKPDSVYDLIKKPLNCTEALRALFGGNRFVDKESPVDCAIKCKDYSAAKQFMGNLPLVQTTYKGEQAGQFKKLNFTRVVVEEELSAAELLGIVKLMKASNLDVHVSTEFKSTGSSRKMNAARHKIPSSTLTIRSRDFRQVQSINSFIETLPVIYDQVNVNTEHSFCIKPNNLPIEIQTILDQAKNFANLSSEFKAIYLNLHVFGYVNAEFDFDWKDAIKKSQNKCLIHDGHHSFKLVLTTVQKHTMIGMTLAVSKSRNSNLAVLLLLKNIQPIV